jgi:hypothetical protein
LKGSPYQENKKELTWHFQSQTSSEFSVVNMFQRPITSLETGKSSSQNSFQEADLLAANMFLS